MLGKRNKARAKAEKKAMFNTLLKFKHSVATPAPKAGTRSANKRKAISEQL
jgi:hypothetical protein